jgi:hypothetical protein
LTTGFAQLRSQLQANARMQMESMKQVNASISATRAQMSQYAEKLCAESALNNALLQKANTNSMRLADSCENLCKLSREGNDKLQQIRYLVGLPS